ncbi:MAG TPA: cysteine--tRNA ligase [Candidatus Moranbacteria bacterium]|nr:cysteine--tRNA ligase [Candidatus Moranbacteria bacterium]
MLRLYNALSRQKEEFKPLETGKVKIYVCGPTVYDHCHLGHGRGYVAMDIIRRYLEYSGYEVRFIMNYTDVGHLVDNAEVGEDKIQLKSKREKVDPMEIVEIYIQSAKEDFQALNIKPANFFPRPTQYIPQMIRFIESLIEKGFAYEKNGSVYFSVEKFPKYGKLSGKKPEELLSGARVEVNPDKKNPLDFALWIKAPKEHLLKWKSPWSEEGYPGWHIECSAMSCDLLGEDTFDIHGGGNENAFPHNENEIAQSEAFLGKPMANYWTLWNMVNVDNKKMGKSLGNFTTIKDALEQYSGNVIRLWIISAHYRSVINYSEKSLIQAENNLNKIATWLEGLKNNRKTTFSEKINLAPYRENFKKAMDDDFNTPIALSNLFELINETNRKPINQTEAQAILNLWEDWNKVFGLVIEKKEEPVPLEVTELFNERRIARDNKDYITSDRLRELINRHGYDVEDTPEGQILRKIK